jgi:predicted nucleic acid-binding Zn ribbon protein
MEQVSNTLQRIMAQALKRLPPEQLPQAAWDFAAGRAVAEKTRVIAYEKQTLLVEVPDANWRAQLYAMAPQFLARLNQFIRLSASNSNSRARKLGARGTGSPQPP